MLLGLTVNGLRVERRADWLGRMEQAVPFLYPDALRTCSLLGEARGLEGSTSLGGFVLSKETRPRWPEAPL